MDESSKLSPIYLWNIGKKLRNKNGIDIVILLICLNYEIFTMVWDIYMNLSKRGKM